MKFTTPYPNALKTEDTMFCRDCCHVGPGDEVGEVVYCELCDSENLTTWREHQREMDAQYEADMIAYDEHVARRKAEIAAGAVAAAEPTYQPGFMVRKQAGGR